LALAATATATVLSLKIARSAALVRRKCLRAWGKLRFPAIPDDHYDDTGLDRGHLDDEPQNLLPIGTVSCIRADLVDANEALTRGNGRTVHR
jgi:hypothetical protein